MARQRPARPCRAQRTDGKPCRAYAIVGGTVCRAHGGAAPQVREAADRRYRMAKAERIVRQEVPKMLARQAQARQERAQMVADVLGEPVEDVVDDWKAGVLAHLTDPALAGRLDAHREREQAEHQQMVQRASRRSLDTHAAPHRSTFSEPSEEGGE